MQHFLTLFLELISANLVLIASVKIFLELFGLVIVPLDRAGPFDFRELLQVNIHASIES